MQKVPEPLEIKLARFNKILEDLREKYKSDPAGRAVYKAQAIAIKLGIQVIEQKLSRTQRKLI